MLVSLNDDPVFNLVLPAKVQAYLAAGKPILGMLCGEGSEVIAEARCGWSVPSGEVSAMAERVVELSRMCALPIPIRDFLGVYDFHIIVNRSPIGKRSLNLLID